MVTYYNGMVWYGNLVYITYGIHNFVLLGELRICYSRMEIKKIYGFRNGSYEIEVEEWVPGSREREP